MRPLHVFIVICFAGLVFTMCQQDAIEPVQEPATPQTQYTVPEIPSEIAALMKEEDIAKFKAGPGEEYQQRVLGRSGYWHPVLMLLGYDLQFLPIGGISCEPGQFVPCFGPGAPADPTECLSSIVGITGFTVADGFWFWQPVHSEYYPVFCAPDYAGYGQGFHAKNNGQLWLAAENTPFQYDAQGNSTFYRLGTYQGMQSNGVYAGAFGWEVAIMYTAAENNPGNNPDGIGYSDVAIFGWVYY